MNPNQSRILIVEDNQAMRKMLESMLIELGYHNYNSAVNGLKAWEAIQEHDVDVVLCDYLMPEMNGLELLRLLRRSKRYYNMPFIMVTGADSRTDFMRTVQAEIDHYLLKPVNIGQLEQLLKKVINAKKNPSPYDETVSRAKFFFLNKEYPQALRHFELARTIKNDSAIPYYYLALIHQQLGDELAAEENFKRSLAQEGQFINSLLSLAEIYEARQDYDNLANCLDRASKIMDDTFDVHIGLSHACTHTGDLDRAKNHLNEALRLARNNQEQLKEVLDGLVEAGLLDEADELFGKKFENDNKEATISFLNRLGLRARKTGDYEKACSFYKNCLKLDPQHKIVNYNLANLHFLRREYEAAECYLHKTLRLYPDFNEAKDLMEAVRRKLSSPE